MRIVTFAFALAAAWPALAQTAPETAPPPRAQEQKSPLDASGMPAPAAKTQDQMPSETRREHLALPPPPRGRYSFAPVDEGFLRFDHKSGEVALCRPQTGGWSCATVAVSGEQRQQEIDDLRDEIAALKQEIASLRALPPPPPPPRPPAGSPPSADRDDGVKLPMPSKDDIARTRVFIEDAWHRLVDMIANMQKDMMRKS